MVHVAGIGLDGALGIDGHLDVSERLGYKTDYSVAAPKAKGLTPAVALPDEGRVSLLRLDAAGGLQYWVGFEDFYVITRCNNSTYYAMTVHQMAQALRQRRGGDSGLRVTRRWMGTLRFAHATGLSVGCRVTLWS
jgi:hypothetical protein